MRSLVVAAGALAALALVVFESRGPEPSAPHHAPAPPPRSDSAWRASSAHCVGDDLSAEAWRRRSCYFRRLCLNASAGPEGEWLYLRDPIDARAGSAGLRDFASAAADAALELDVSLGGLNAQLPPEQQRRMRWAPRVVDADPARGLPRAVTLEPLANHRGGGGGAVAVLHAAYSPTNPAHLLLDELYAWWALRELFGLARRPLAPLRAPRPGGGDPLWMSCEQLEADAPTDTARAAARAACEAAYARWLPMVGVAPPVETWPELTARAAATLAAAAARDVEEGIDAARPAAELACVDHVLAGVGGLDDHCGLPHTLRQRAGAAPSSPAGARAADVPPPLCNLGRGSLLWRFRAFARRNLAGGDAAADDDAPAARAPTVTFLMNSTARGFDWRRMELVAERLEAELGRGSGAVVRRVDLGRLDARAQVALLGATAVLVAVGGGGAVAAGLFLPRGAAAVIVADGGVYNDFDTSETHAAPLSLGAELSI